MNENQISQKQKKQNGNQARKVANPHPPRPPFFDRTAAAAAVASASVSVSCRAPPDPKGKLIVLHLTNSETQKLSSHH